jgi:hypothetical protein
MENKHKGKQYVITFNVKWDEHKKIYDNVKMINDFLDYVGDNNLYINQIIRWNDTQIVALVEEKDFKDISLEGIENLI